MFRSSDTKTRPGSIPSATAASTENRIITSGPHASTTLRCGSSCAASSSAGHDADAAPPALAGGVDRDRELEVVALAPGVELLAVEQLLGSAAAVEHDHAPVAARGPRAPRRSPAAAARGRARRRRRRRRCPRPDAARRARTAPGPRAVAGAGGADGPCDRAHGADRVHQCPRASRIAADRDRHLTDAERVQHRELAGFEAQRLAALGDQVERPGVLRLAPGRVDPEAAPGPATHSSDRRDRVAVEVEQPHARRLQALGDHRGEPAHKARSRARCRSRTCRAGRRRRRRRRARCRRRARRNAPGRAARARTSRARRRGSSVSITSRGRAGAAISSATIPVRMTKNVSAGSPWWKAYSPSRKTSLRPQPAISSRCSSRMPGEERGLGHQLRDRPHLVSPSVARIAAASSVMSMATGHQVMQRPQPTQPEVPNWSCQVPSLWVIHCR